MPQSLANVILHVVFSTKNREPFLGDRSIRDQMHAVLGGAARTLQCDPICIGGVADHVHLLISQSRTLAIAECVKEIKRVSSTWAHEKPHTIQGFHWQSGYGVFSVSESRVEKAKAYIRNQEEHHRRMTFQEEYRSLLERHAIAYDERYVWD